MVLWQAEDILLAYSIVLGDGDRGECETAVYRLHPHPTTNAAASASSAWWFYSLMVLHMMVLSGSVYSKSWEPARGIFLRHTCHARNDCTAAVTYLITPGICKTSFSGIYDSSQTDGSNSHPLPANAYGKVMAD